MRIFKPEFKVKLGTIPKGHLILLDCSTASLMQFFVTTDHPSIVLDGDGERVTLSGDKAVWDFGPGEQYIQESHRSRLNVR